MKTILVVYTNVKRTTDQYKGMKKYSFNTEADVQIGEMLETSAYDTKLQVVKILDKSFKYYNAVTGEMSDEFNNSLQWEIQTLDIQTKAKKNDSVILAFRVEGEE